MILFGLTFRCALRARSFGLRVQLTASHGVLSVVTIHYRKSESKSGKNANLIEEYDRILLGLKS